METTRNNSKKRDAIYHVIASTTAHPTAETVYEALKGEIPSLSLGTVYRNIGILEELGMIQGVCSVAGHERFDARTDPHAHFSCRCCGKVLDVELTEECVAEIRTACESSGFDFEFCTLNFSGLCPECADKADSA